MKPEDRITLEHIHLAPAQLENLEGCLRAVPETDGITTAINALHTLKRALLAVKREHPLPVVPAAETEQASVTTDEAGFDKGPVELSREPVTEGAPVDTAAAPSAE